MTLLLLARHAAHATVNRVLCGRSPGVHLGDAGRHQAARLAGRLRRDAPAALYASPQPRARETAEALGLPVRVEPALDEIDFGAWAGRPFAELEADPAWRRWNEQRATARPPGGEAMHEAQSRVLRWTATLPALHPGETVVAVSHADVIKAAVMAHLGLPLDAHWRLDIAPASLSGIELWEGGGRVRFVNEMLEG